MRVFWTVVITLVLLGVGVVLFAYSGFYDVAATQPHNALVAALLDTAMTRSVRSHGANIEAPDLSEPSMVKQGATTYAHMCVPCHGAPGVDKSPIGKGLYPSPPSLYEGEMDWSPGEVFWILDHGIKDTGMPGFGPTHSEQALWSVVAFVERMHGMSPEDYKQMTRETEPGPAEGEHHQETEEGKGTPAGR